MLVEKIKEIMASSVPLRIKPLWLILPAYLPKRTKEIASRILVFPAPTSPRKMFNPGVNSISESS